MSNHPLLRNIDILHEICTVLGQSILEERHYVICLYPGDRTLRDVWNARRALFALSLTCRTFMPVAINVLWRSLPQMDPLLNVLGYSADEKDEVETVLNWTRLEWYARRVRSILFCEEDADVPTFILNRMAPLLPNLCTLHWGRQSLELAPCLFLPSLRHFMCLSHYSEPSLPAIHSCMDSLAISPARLQRLRLSGCDTRVSAQLKTFRHLRDLALPCNALSSAVWQNLAMMPLERLAIYHMEEESEDFDFHQVVAMSSTTGLKSLKLLDIMGSWENIVSVARDIPSTEIAEVELMYPWFPETQPDYLSEWRDVAQSLSTKSLRSLNIRHYPRWGGPVHDLAVATIEPLFAFSTLENLELTFETGISTMTDDDIRRLASALPRLTTFRLLVDSSNDDVGTGLTIQSVIYLATTSSKLEFLHIDINVDLLPDPQDVPLTSCPVFDIVLRLRTAPPPDLSLRSQMVDTLANILGRLFPELEYVRTQGERWYRPTEGDWEEQEVDRVMFPEFHSSSEEEGDEGDEEEGDDE